MADDQHELGARRATVDGLLAAVVDRYGDRFTDADRAAIRRQIEELVGAADVLRQVPLVNGDEPDLVFVARGGTAEP